MVWQELDEYLIENIYPKLGYIKIIQDEALKEIRAVLLANDIGQGGLKLDGEEGNPQAVKELRDYLGLVASKGKILLSDLVERFTARPTATPKTHPGWVSRRSYAGVTQHPSLKYRGQARSYR